MVPPRMIRSRIARLLVRVSRSVTARYPGAPKEAQALLGALQIPQRSEADQLDLFDFEEGGDFGVEGAGVVVDTDLGLCEVVAAQFGAVEDRVDQELGDAARRHVRHMP